MEQDKDDKDGKQKDIMGLKIWFNEEKKIKSLQIAHSC